MREVKEKKKEKDMLQERILPGSRNTFCNICNSETLVITIRNPERRLLFIGRFCPKCDKKWIEKLKEDRGKVWKKPGPGPHVPFDSKGFGAVNPWRSKRGDRDIGSKSGEWGGPDLLAHVFMGTIKPKVKKPSRDTSKDEVASMIALQKQRSLKKLASQLPEGSKRRSIRKNKRRLRQEIEKMKKKLNWGWRKREKRQKQGA